MKWLLFVIGVFFLLAALIILGLMAFALLFGGDATAEAAVRGAIYLPLGVLCLWLYGRMKKQETQ